MARSCIWMIICIHSRRDRSDLWTSYASLLIFQDILLCCHPQSKVKLILLHLNIPPKDCAVCTAATFYSVSISKPIPVWFGKKIKILTTCFPNQFQFGLEKNYNFDDSFSKPIPVWFGKNDHFSETKNSKLIPHFFGKT